MRAVTIVDGALEINERPNPIPGPREVLVEVASAGINAADLLQRRGFYPAPPGAPADIPGLEFAGTVVAVGSDVTTMVAGDRVMAVVAGGGQASHALVDERHVLAVPPEMDLVAAGGFAEAFTTAHDALVTQGRLSEGSRVLITGAAGGVGTAGVQIAHHLGAVVIACARDTRRAAALRSLGADEVVSPDDVAGAGPFDVVLELIGAQSLANGVLQSLAHGARVVVIGVGGGSRVELDLLSVMATRATITGSTLRARSLEEKALVAEAMRVDVLPLLRDGRLEVPILATYRLEEVATAYDRFSDGAKLGKIVLLP